MKKKKKKKKNKVYTLFSEQDFDREDLGVYDSPRAMVAGLAAAIYEDHAAAKDADPKEIAKIVALAVFDFVALCGFESDRDECQDGDTVFRCCEDEVQSLDEGGEDHA